MTAITSSASWAAGLSDSDAKRLRENQVQLGLWIFLATVTMLFAAFASAYVVRRSGSDWRHVALPRVLWTNTAILVLSSVVLEASVRAGARRAWTPAAAASIGALVLGIAFLAGQVMAWRDMAWAGMYLPTTPHSSFFFMLTGAHAVHVVAALAVLAWGAASTMAGASQPRVWKARMDLCRTFWHYLGAVWLLLFALITRY